MDARSDLSLKLDLIDGKTYGAYQNILGYYIFSDFTLKILSIPKDPYASPGSGLFRIFVASADAGFPEDLGASRRRQIAVGDYLARQWHSQCLSCCGGKRGTGYSGTISIEKPGQSILLRSSVIFNDEGIEVRFFMGMPSEGRKVNAGLAKVMFLEELPKIVAASLFFSSLDKKGIYRHIEVDEDSQALREKLQQRDYIAFIKNNAILPRESGISQLPLSSGDVIPFQAPESMQEEFDLPNVGIISGMVIKKGICLIVGGGYHGKTTLLQTIEQGIYNHIPGDGREYCVSAPLSTKIRASNGRYVEKTDISLFINHLPFLKNTSAFSSSNASGSTSQAASIIEALEIGANVLLMDEDTSAANFLMRDHRMQQLVGKEQEPITSLINRVEDLYGNQGISTIIVMGGSGEYFDVCNQVISMTEYIPFDVSQKAKTIALENLSYRTVEGPDDYSMGNSRVPLKASIDPEDNEGRLRLRALERTRLQFGQSMIDLGDVEQIVELAQAKTILKALVLMKSYIDDERPLNIVLSLMMDDINAQGLDILDDRKTGDLAECRALEMAAAFNRLRCMKIKG